MSFTLIYTRSDKWLISKEPVDWKVWNDKLYWFMTSLTYDTSEELAEFLKEDFHLSEESKRYIINALDNTDTNYELAITKDNTVTIKTLHLDLLHSKGEVIDWEEWFYYFAKVSERYELWVYLGGIADLTREIRLSNKQVEQWKEKGNTFIRELASELQLLNSTSYAEAIREQRKIL